MLTLKEAIEIANQNLSGEQTLLNSYGEVQHKYVFTVLFKGVIPPGGGKLTVDKTTGECKWEYLEREFIAPYAPIRGYKKLELKGD